MVILHITENKFGQQTQVHPVKRRRFFLYRTCIDATLPYTLFEQTDVLATVTSAVADIILQYSKYKKRRQTLIHTKFKLQKNVDHTLDTFKQRPF